MRRWRGVRRGRGARRLGGARAAAASRLLGRQLAAATLRAQHLRAHERAKRETVSGARSDLSQLRRALAQLGKDDVLLVPRLDRLARSTRDLLNTLDAIAKAGAGFCSLTASAH